MVDHEYTACEIGTIGEPYAHSPGRGRGPRRGSVGAVRNILLLNAIINVLLLNTLF
jgi:hypothetical protein